MFCYGLIYDALRKSDFVASNVKLIDKKGNGNNFYESSCNLTRYKGRICLGGLKKTTTIREDSQCSDMSLAQAWFFYVNTNSFVEKWPSQKTKFLYVSYKLFLETYEFVKGCL